jgi:pantoate--beta-alanine ligase
LILFKKIKDLVPVLDSARENGQRIGFVPTMGALHQGHLELIRYANTETQLSICSIFVNPTQFNERSDFEKYPKPIETDIEKLYAANCKVLFTPGEHEIYTNGKSGLKHYDIGALENILEGKSRPGHFQGVCQVVDRLLEIVNPDTLFMGQKDFQQTLVVKRLIEITGKKTVLKVCPIVREADGLAMSSRNVRLNESERRDAAQIYAGLNYIKENCNKFPFEELKNKVLDNWKTISSFNPDYLEFCNAENLQPVKQLKDTSHVVVLTAVIVGNVRLIDNVLLS